MTGRVLLIDHPVGQRDDRASHRLACMGFELQWCCPGRGDALPEAGAAYEAVLVYGGTENLSEDGHLDYLQTECAWIGRWVAEDRPLLGICLGGQLLAQSLGGEVTPHPEGVREVGYAGVTPTASGLAEGFMQEPMQVYQWHKEGFTVPEGAEALVTGSVFENQAFRYGARAYGIQFHPEVTKAVIERWLCDASDALSSPGAHPPERQVADAARYDAQLETWLETFLDRWLGQ